MRRRRRCMLLMGLVSFCFFTVYFPILWSIRPEDVEVWNMTRDMHILVRPFNVTILLAANREACQRRPLLLQPSAAGGVGSGGDADIPRELEEDDDASAGERDEDGVFLLVAVCSSVSNFEARLAIRETWGRQGAVHPSAIPPSVIPQLYPSNSMATGQKILVQPTSLPAFGHSSSPQPNTKLLTDGSFVGRSHVGALVMPLSGVHNNSHSFNVSLMDGLHLPSNATVRVIFMLGRTPNDTLQRLLDQESQRYGDLVQEDFLDTYNNLTLKSVMLLKWVNSSCRQASYVMKTDDDTFVNVPRLVRHLQVHGRANLLLGCLICHARPVKNKRSKWYAPRVLFNERVYPVYLSGTGYVMSADLVPRLYEAALDTPFFHLEDIFVTGLCARRLRVRPVDFEGFTYQQRKRNPCLYHFGITGHRVAPADFRAIWRDMWAPNLRCDRSKVRLRNFYSSKCV